VAALPAAADFDKMSEADKQAFAASRRLPTSGGGPWFTMLYR